MQSLRYIERKNSVIFGKITAKKLLTVLQDDGQIDKEKVFIDEEETPQISLPKKDDEIKRFNSLPFKESKTETLKSNLREEGSVLRSPSNRKFSDKGVYNINSPVGMDGLLSKEKKILVKKDNSKTVNKTSIYEKVKELMLSVPPPDSEKADELKPTGEEGEREENKLHAMCIICEQKKANSIIYPCFHSKVCYECCLNMLGWQYSKCHYCRQNLEKIIVFDPSYSYKNIYKVIEVYGINYEEE